MTTSKQLTQKQLLARQAELQAEVEVVNKQLAAKRKAKLVQCAHCEKRTTISKLRFLTITNYSPYGGDGWDKGRWYDAAEGFLCEKCDTWNLLQSTYVNEQRLGDSYPRDHVVPHPLASLKGDFATRERVELNKFRAQIVGHIQHGNKVRSCKVFVR